VGPRNGAGPLLFPANDGAEASVAVTIRWRPVRFALFLCGAWFIGAVVITAIIAVEVQQTPAAPYVYAVWGLLFAAASYFVLSLALNRTTIEVVSGRLVARNGPLPFARDRASDVANVAEIVVGSNETAGFMGGRGGKLYTLWARTADGASLPLVTWALIGKGERSDADDLARQIEAMLWKGGSA
jgi:hypothetical protein